MPVTSVTLEAVELTKRFGERTAVDGVSFVARRGDVVGLLGPNGAGKTTTIRLLTTVLEPTRGQFSVDGISSSQPMEIRRRIGVLPESAGYPEHQTGSEFLRHHARLHGRGRAEATEVAGRLLTDLGLADRASSRISTYSRGMRQRLGIARALVNDPSVVFLDEPTLGLDPAGQRQMLGIVREIARDSQATVVVSTHSLHEVEQICTNVLILSEGRLVASGSVADVAQSVGLPPSAELTVPVQLVDRTLEALRGVDHVTVEANPDRSGVLVISAKSTGPRSQPDTGMNAALRAVLNAEVPVLALRVEGARLSDAFDAMTQEYPR
jgi:ABC-2 type transport system ATP-binding protein